MKLKEDMEIRKYFEMEQKKVELKIQQLKVQKYIVLR